MNNEKIKEYFDILNQRDRINDQCVYDVLMDKLDYIWYHEFTDEDIHHVTAQIEKRKSNHTGEIR